MSRRVTPLVVIALVAVLVLTGAGCGDKSSTSTSSPAAAVAADVSAGDILKKSVEAMNGYKSVSGTMDMAMDMQAPSPTASAAGTAQGPIRMKGDWAAGQEPQEAEITISMAASGMTVDMGVKYVGDKAWIQYMGQWYVAPPGTMKQLRKQSAGSGQDSPAGQLKLLQGMGLDPASWAAEMTVVGTEQMGGASTYHIAIEADTAKILTDLMKMTQDPKVAKLMGDQADTLGAKPPELTEQDKKDIEEMFRSVSADVWIDTSSYYVRKMTVDAEIVAPPGGTADVGFEAMKLTMTVTFDEFDQPITVEPPADAKPWKDLEGAGAGLPNLSI